MGKQIKLHLDGGVGVTSHEEKIDPLDNIKLKLLMWMFDNNIFLLKIEDSTNNVIKLNDIELDSALINIINISKEEL